MKAEKFNNPLLHMMDIPSSAADVWTRKQPETNPDTETVENTAPIHTYDELKKMRWDAYIKMVVIAGFIAVALVFGSVQAITIQMTI